MRTLYEARFARGHDIQSAVRETSLAILAELRANGERADPRRWAGFIASGDWR
jgi:hypothetical protein